MKLLCSKKLLLLFALILASCKSSVDPAVATPEVYGAQLPEISNKTLEVNQEFTLDINDNVTGKDFDQKGNPITYYCKVDLVIDKSVSSPTSCESFLSGFSLNTQLGTITWTPNFGHSLNGPYELKVFALSKLSMSEQVFTITVELGGVDPFILTWRTTTSDEDITLPLKNGFNYNFTIDWGDGESSEITAYNDADATHTYADPDDYTITIIGEMEAWGFVHMGVPNQIAGAPKVISLSSFGDVGLTDISGLFYSATNLEEMTGVVDSNMTNLMYMFVQSGDVTVDTSAWDTSNVTNMGGMLALLANTVIDVGNLDTSSVTDMSLMFYNSPNLNPDTSNWDVRSVTTMTQMFDGSGLSTANYDKFLIMSAATATQNNVQVDSPATFTVGASGDRDYLINTLGWTVNDAGAD